MAVDFSTPLGKVRALIPDTEEVDWDDSGTTSFLLPDGHLSALLSLNNDQVRLAAADACEAIGMSEALISKVIKTEDLETDGAKNAQVFLTRARQLRDAHKWEQDVEASGHFQLVKFRQVPPNIFRRRL